MKRFTQAERSRLLMTMPTELVPPKKNRLTAEEVLDFIERMCPLNKCSYPGCYNEAIWTRKEGWMVAPGSPEGSVCETHHCWEPISHPNDKS